MQHASHPTVPKKDIRPDFNNFVSNVRDDHCSDADHLIEAKVSNSTMGPGHCTRHRLGIFLVCLISLVVVRDPSLEFQSNVSSTSQRLLNTQPTEFEIGTVPRFQFGYTAGSTGDYGFEPLFFVAGSENLPMSRAESSGPKQLEFAFGDTAELNTHLNPKAFPQAWQFVHGGSSEDPIGPAPGQPTTREIYSGANGSVPWVWWPETVANCAVGTENPKARCDIPSAELRIPEPGSLALLLTGVSIIGIIRRFA
jgi:hypothetical protein